VHKHANLTLASKVEEIHDKDDTLLETFSRVCRDAWVAGMDLCVDADFNKITLKQNPNIPDLTSMVKEFSLLEHSEDTKQFVAKIAIRKAGFVRKTQ
jgi:hypothetical protein